VCPSVPGCLIVLPNSLPPSQSELPTPPSAPSLQCDPRWGSDIMQTVTICDVGCLMSSTSMAIGGKSIAIENATSTPGTLNAFLRKVGG